VVPTTGTFAEMIAQSKKKERADAYARYTKGWR
jgi:hypothetical protein